MSAGHINPWDIRDQKMYILEQLDFSFPDNWPEKKTNLTLKIVVSKRVVFKMFRWEGGD